MMRCTLFMPHHRGVRDAPEHQEIRVFTVHDGVEPPTSGRAFMWRVACDVTTSGVRAITQS